MISTQYLQDIYTVSTCRPHNIYACNNVVHNINKNMSKYLQNIYIIST